MTERAETTESVRGIDVESVVTVDGNCAVSCAVIGDEIEFILGPPTNGLVLYFNWQGLSKFLGVAGAMVTQVREAPPGKQVRVSVSADERSRQVHGPNI
jgi:hypothetical protein